MKKIIAIAGLAALICSCTKDEKKETDMPKCPVISKEAVPLSVKQAFATKYPADSVITWFDKSGSGYCAYFIQPVTVKKLAEFSTTGLFIREETDLDHDGNFEDSTSIGTGKTPAVCECDIE